MPAVDVVAIGNAIVDVLVHCDDALLEQLCLEKGTMSLVSAERAAEIYAALGPCIEVSGGSAANTAAGIASIGGHAAFIGKVRDDEFGTIFAHDLRAAGVRYLTRPATVGPQTAQCLVLVTPDAQRTMCTYLGTAGELTADDIDRDLLSAAAVTFVEGYLVGLPTAEPALNAAITATHAAGGLVALSLSDRTWVAAHPDVFDALLTCVDVVLANEQEACQITGEPNAEAALKLLSRSCSVVAVTRSEHGALITDGAQITAVPAHTANRLVDTTGAGDLFASGFLLGLTRGLDIIECARLGAVAAAEVISHLGARPETSLADLATAAGVKLQLPVRAHP